MKLGIDFGSTYSTLAMYISSEDRIKALTLMEGESSNIASVVAVSKSKGTFFYAGNAKKKVGNDAFNVYEAFKMLLVEPDKEILAARGYNEIYTPRYITKCFIEYLLKGVINRYGNGEETIDQLVICIPEVWSTNLRTFNSRNILREIISEDVEFPDGWTIKKENIRVVTEPEAASAFFAYNYEHKVKKKFNGHLLLIDYGGGTLDITLTEVRSDGNMTMEIGYRESGGAGENHPDSFGDYYVGNAGIAYMQKVVMLAIEDSDIFGDGSKPDINSQEFKKAIHELEDALKEPMHIFSLETFFNKYGNYNNFDKVLKEEAEGFCEVFYEDCEVTVTYQHLFRAYQFTIEGVLQNELDRINKAVEKHIGKDPCKRESGDNDVFKIAVVGGFGSFYLVKKHIAAIYDFDPDEKNDMRLKNIYSEESEQAIALGAGLIASGRVTLQKTARFSIGIYSRNTANRHTLSYGIRYHQLIEPGNPYFLLNNNEEVDTVKNRIIYGGLKNNIKQFVVQFSDDYTRGFPMAIKKGFHQKLDALPDAGMWYCGFSMDQNDIISFHIEPVSALKDIYKGLIIPLDNYTNLFDLTGGREVYSDEE